MSLRIRSGAQHPSATALTRFPVRLTPYRTQHFFPAYHRLYTMAAVRAYYCDQDDGHDADDVAALAQEFEGMGLTGSTGQSRQLKRRAANVSEKLGGQETRSHANKELDVDSRILIVDEDLEGKEAEEMLNVCPQCGFHWYVSAKQRDFGKAW